MVLGDAAVVAVGFWNCIARSIPALAGEGCDSGVPGEGGTVGGGGGNVGATGREGLGEGHHEQVLIG